MKTTRTVLRRFTFSALVLAGLTLGAKPAFAHCDGLDGPVVAAARVALESEDVRHALVWVLPDGDAEVRQAFDHAVHVRKLSEEARELADRYFFETLVRVHRQGEGEPYTGLKPAGRDLGAAIPAADLALQTGAVAELEALLIEEIRHGLHERFHAAVTAREFAPEDVNAGRAFVAAYVPFLHFVEGLYEAARGGAHPHGEATNGTATAVERHDAH